MSVETAITSFAAAPFAPIALPTPAEQPWLRPLKALSHAMGDAEMTVLDAVTGEVLQHAPGQPNWNWDAVVEVAREVSRQGRPEFVLDEGPLAVLAVPLVDQPKIVVALRTMLTRTFEFDEEFSSAARHLDVDRRAVARWARKQRPADDDGALRIAQHVVARHRAERRVEQLQRELESITGQLLSTYEEISLLHRLAKNLKLSRSEKTLGREALSWLADVLPAKALYLKFCPRKEEGEVASALSSDDATILHGDSPLDADEIDGLLATIVAAAPAAGHEPIVLNHYATGRAEWNYPGIREMVAVPLFEVDHRFGWLLAINHIDGGEFGTVETSLLSSVGAILGIHSGNLSLYREQAEFLANVIRALTSAIDAKDPYTCGHSDRVARVAVRIAKELNLDGQKLKTLYLSGLLHDIGKIGIDDNVLRKPGRLTEAEYEHIKLHPEMGYKILRDLKQLDDVLPVVLHHHEAWDGKGYPHGLAGEEIPLLARIVAVADSYDAMSSDRPYRRGMPDEKLDAIFHDGAGKQWDAKVIETFFKVRDDIREISRSERETLRLDGHQWT